jgi:hypothetical protein
MTTYIPTITVDGPDISPPSGTNEPVERYRASAAEVVDCLEMILDKLTPEASYDLALMPHDGAKGPPETKDIQWRTEESFSAAEEHEALPAIARTETQAR